MTEFQTGATTGQQKMLRASVSKSWSGNECISGLDDDKLSRFALGAEAGQLSRFEVILDLNGRNYLQSHPWVMSGTGDWYRRIGRRGGTSKVRCVPLVVSTEKRSII